MEPTLKIATASSSTSALPPARVDPGDVVVFTTHDRGLRWAQVNDLVKRVIGSRGHRLALGRLRLRRWNRLTDLAPPSEQGSPSRPGGRN